MPHDFTATAFGTWATRSSSEHRECGGMLIPTPEGSSEVKFRPSLRTIILESIDIDDAKIFNFTV